MTDDVLNPTDSAILDAVGQCQYDPEKWANFAWDGDPKREVRSTQVKNHGQSYSGNGGCLFDK